VDISACNDQYQATQIARRDKRIRDARAAAAGCQVKCPAEFAQECAVWEKELVSLQPSIVVEVRRQGGGAVAGARVSLDGKPIVVGTEIELEPGSLSVTAEAPAEAPITQKVELNIGEKRKAVRITFPSNEEPAPFPPIGAWVFAGFGVAHLVQFGVLAGLGSSKEGDLDACKPNCAQEDVDEVESFYLGADIGLGLGAGALGVAVIWTIVDYAVRPETPTAPSATGSGLVWRF
jgi:hypothetical protein